MDTNERFGPSIDRRVPEALHGTRDALFFLLAGSKAAPRAQTKVIQLSQYTVPQHCSEVLSRDDFQFVF